MDSLVFDLMQQENFEAIYFFQEKTSGLKAVIAIHESVNAITCLCQWA